MLHTVKYSFIFLNKIFGNPKTCSYYENHAYIQILLGENVHIPHISENPILGHNCSHPYLLGFANNLDPNPCIFQFSVISQRRL